MFIRDMAGQLRARGHHPVLYSTSLGSLADECRRAGFEVIGDLAELAAPPDVIHAQHHLDAMSALLRFPRVPAVLFCHGFTPWEEMPVRFPSVRRYAAVDDPTLERVRGAGVEPARIRVLRTAVDLERFALRAGLPERPERAVVFSNYMTSDERLAIIRAACAQVGIRTVDIIGLRAGTEVAEPEKYLGDYQVVFAKGRAAHEAAATGAAVVVSDYGSLGGMLTLERYPEWRSLNLGFRLLRQPLAVGALVRELRRYDAADAMAVARRLRSEASLTDAAERLMEIYAEVRVEADELAAVPQAEFARAASEYVAMLARHYKAHALESKAEHWLARWFRRVRTWLQARRKVRSPHAGA